MEKEIEELMNDSKIETSVIDDNNEVKEDEDLEDEEVLDIKLVGEFDDEGYLQNSDFLYMLSKLYSKDLLRNFKALYFEYARKIYDFTQEKINDGVFEDLDDVIKAAKLAPSIEKKISEFEKEVKTIVEKKEHDEMVKREKEEKNSVPYKDEMRKIVDTLGTHLVYRPLSEFYMKGYSKKPLEEKLITQELQKENRDFSAIIASDYQEKLDVLSARDYLNNYVKFLVYRSVSTGRGVLSEDEIRKTFNNSIEPLAQAIHDKFYKEPMPYNHRYQEMIENKKEVFNLNSKERMNLLKNLKGSILESLDNKYDTKTDYLLTTQKQKFRLMKEAVYNQSIWKKIFKFGQFLKEKQELVEVCDRLCSSLHISKDKLFNTMDERDTKEYQFFILESKSLYDAKNDVDDIIKEVKEKNVYKAPMKVEEIKADNIIEEEKDLSNVKDLNLDFEVIDETLIETQINSK